MKTNPFRKAMLEAVITISTASVYYAQSSDSLRHEKKIDEIVISSVVDIAKDRKTPVAVSNIKESAIIEKIGNQEFPEILNSTPSVYATKSGGGFGDSRLNIRGFEQKNIAVMINGMPVNDMESGQVYFSNWAGLTDVTSSMQIQRGLGASKLAISSVGGTVNIITRSSDKKQGGRLSIGIANNGYHKSVFSYNTGKTKSGWSSSFLMSRTAGAMYVDRTNFESYNYFFALGYKPNKKHEFQVMITGAPQTHEQRRYQISISNYIKYGNGIDVPNRRYNSDWGYLNGKEYAWPQNFYHKPVAMFNWDWIMDDKNNLSTVVYSSWGRGGGGGSPLTAKGVNMANYRLDSGLLNIDQIVADNMASPTAPKVLRKAGINQHDWYGILSNLTHKFNSNWQISGGFDGRYYKGYHFEVPTDFLGADSYTNYFNKNLSDPVIIKEAHQIRIPWNPFQNITTQKLSYHNDGEVLWGGLFGQLEYSIEKLSAFLQGSLSSQGFQRIDHYLKPGTLAIASNPESKMNTKTGFHYLTGYNIKSGINYNINEHHNVFGNIGYYEKQPVFNSVYANNKNYLNQNLTNEKIFGLELGYSFRSAKFNTNINLYRTTWADRYLSIGNRFALYDYNAQPDNNGNYPALPKQTIQGKANIFGVKEIHQGVEMDMEYKAAKFLSFIGMFSLGDWYYDSDVTASYFDESNKPILGQNKQEIDKATLYLKNVKVGNSAQLTSSLGLRLKPVEGLTFTTDWRFVDKLYSDIQPTRFNKPDHKGALQLPSYNLLDLGFSYKLKVGSKEYFTFRANVYNLFDTIYIAESRTNTYTKTLGDFKDNGKETAQQQYDSYIKNDTYKGIDRSNEVFFGFGRTWSASLSFNF